MKMNGIVIEYPSIKYPCEYEIVFENSLPTDGIDQWINYIGSHDGMRYQQCDVIPATRTYDLSLPQLALSVGEKSVDDMPRRSKASSVPYTCAINVLTGGEKRQNRHIVDINYN